jgi:ribonuclease inhibitor
MAARVILDTSECATVDEFHRLLKKELSLPDYYGENLDALWDCLTGWVDVPLIVEWRGFDEIRKNIGDYADKALDTFREAERARRGFQVEVM